MTAESGGAIRRKRSEFNTTLIDEHIIAAAAIPGGTFPMIARGMAAML
ncbi:MAG: hypothetical protein IID36_02470 [Planctomycetes bacterium]|nr:hypothetical protein [Planctomycetota bacterium]